MIYSNHSDSYLEKFRKERRDFTRFIPAKKIEKFPRSGNESLLGWTYLGDDRIHLREDLEGERKLEVDIHESIHTNDEYETRRIVEEILEGLKSKERKYKNGAPGYKI